MPDENKNFRGSLFLDFRFEVALKNQHYSKQYHAASLRKKIANSKYKG